MTTYQGKFKHKLMLGEDALGDVVSFDDNKHGATIENKLTLTTVKKTDLPWLEQAKESFFFGINTDKPDNKALLKYRQSLKDDQSKCAVVTMFSSTAALLPVSYPDKHRYGYTSGFVVRVCPGTEVTRPVEEDAVTFFIPALHSFSLPAKHASVATPAGPALVPAGSTASVGQHNIAESHYNELVRDRETRHLSQIVHLRNCNNFLKSSLISLTATLLPRQGLKVLDLACGKGGDMLKWLKHPSGLADYVGVDIAEQSLQDFVKRLQGRSDKDARKIRMLIAADLTHQSLKDVLPVFQWGFNGQPVWSKQVPSLSSGQFDIVSCQFALHYMFGSAAHIENVMREVSTALSPGGLFLATTIDCTILAETLLLVRHGGTLPAYLTCSTDQGTSKLLYSNDIGHPLLRLSLSEASVHSLLHGDGNGIGIEYTFTLLDSSDSSAVDAPEYIIPQGEVLQTLLAAHGLRLVEAVNFQTLFHRLVDRPGSAEMMMRMHVLNMEGTMTDAEWAIARLYTALVIEKVDSNASCGGVGDIWRSMFGTASAPASHQDDMEVVTACVDYDPTEGLSSPPHSPPGTPPRRTSICVAEPCCPPPAHYPMSPSTRTASNTAPLKWFPSVYETAPGEAIALADLPALQARLQAAAVGRNKVEAKEEEQMAVDEEEDEDPEVLLFLRQRSAAMDLAGGEDAWDALDEDAQSAIMEKAIEAVRKEDEEMQE